MTLAEQYMAFEMEKQASALGKTPKAVRTLKWRLDELLGGEAARHRRSGSGPGGYGPVTPAADRAAAEAAERTTVARQHAGIGAGAALATVGGAAMLHKLLSRKATVGQKLVGAFKRNRVALGIGGGAAAGLGGLAAYRKHQGQ